MKNTAILINISRGRNTYFKMGRLTNFQVTLFTNVPLSKLEWERYRRFFYIKNYWFVYIPPYSFWIIPELTETEKLQCKMFKFKKGNPVISIILQMCEEFWIGHASLEMENIRRKMSFMIDADKRAIIMKNLILWIFLSFSGLKSSNY